MGLALALLAAICLVGAGVLAAKRGERMSPELKSAGRSVLVAAVLNLVPGLGLWLVVKRPVAALLNLILAILVVALMLWVESKHFHYWPLKDHFVWILWLGIGSVAWAYNAQLRKAGLTEKAFLDASRSE
jgi:hypothetical protein